MERTTVNDIQRLLGSTIESIMPVGNGRNSRTYKVVVSGGVTYAVKRYLGRTTESKSRMANEFTSLEFMCGSGVGSVPKPIMSDSARDLAVYEFIEGISLNSEELSVGHIDQASEFLCRLYDIKNVPESKNIPTAAEANFSVSGIFNNIHTRLDKLVEVRDGGPQNEALDGFLESEFRPFFSFIQDWCKGRLKESGLTPTTVLPLDKRTLNPSDFGFHNCIRRGDGSLVFLDFEYFGWDDPAKMICDFFLHPAMEVKNSLKLRFADKVLGHIDQDGSTIRRIPCVYPLFGLKWCLIMLNVFLPEYRDNRGLTDDSGLVDDNLLSPQLTKARSLMATIASEYDSFLQEGA